MACSTDGYILDWFRAASKSPITRFMAKRLSLTYFGPFFVYHRLEQGAEVIARVSTKSDFKSVVNK